MAAAASVLLSFVLITTVRSPSALPAAGGVLVLDVLADLERYYIAPVHPIALLNEALGGMRQATHESRAALPDIPRTDTEPQADRVFLHEFHRAADVRAVAETQLAYAATRSMLAALHDSHTFYVSPGQLAKVVRQFDGRSRVGETGLILASRAAGAGKIIFVWDVAPASPADSAGVARLDRVVRVDGKAQRSATVAAVSQSLTGPIGSKVTVTVRRRAEIRTVSLTRAAVYRAPVHGEFVHPGIAWIRVANFDVGTASMVAGTLEGLARVRPVTAVILDLRDNQGGLMGEAVATAALLVPDGTVLARASDRDGRTYLLRTSGEPRYLGTRAAVIVNHKSASASEMIAAAYEEDHRAAVVGETTAGALAAARAFALPEGRVSITMGRIVTPAGRQVEGVGVHPDVAVPLTVADIERGQDTQLEAAIRAVSRPETGRRGR